MQRLPLNGLSFFLSGFFFHRYWQFTRQQEKGGDHRHSYLPPLHGNTFNYWNATRWDLPPGEIIIWLIDYDWMIDGMLLSVYLMICNTLHKILRSILLPPLSMLLASIRERFLAQVSVVLTFQYATTLNRRKVPDFFLQSRPFPNFHIFFQELT